MTVKEWLKKGRRLNIEIAELEKAKENAFNLACGGSAVGGGEKVQTSRGNSTEGKFSEYAQYSADMDNRLKELYTYQRKMLKLINRVDDSTYRALLIAYYVNCKPWAEVAKTIGYEVRYTQKLHGLALQKLKNFKKT